MLYWIELSKFWHHVWVGDIFFVGNNVQSGENENLVSACLLTVVYEQGSDIWQLSIGRNTQEHVSCWSMENMEFNIVTDIVWKSSASLINCK